MNRKVLIPLLDEDVAPRFDLATDVLIAVTDSRGAVRERKLLIMPHGSAEKLCQLVITEQVGTVICGGIEEEHYDYLAWKQVRVIDNVIGAGETALQQLGRNRLKNGDVLKMAAEGK